ncbi:MAG: hypothetical protein CVV42_09670 [Candidatus Riflebacteria bacterium HGW-Riflebacteria-2]|jgi:hypothetical protein|nr:MAG: hypothetical protein CVV42_09670 [Candidatus Riflebacteria bacterium HGW-Riflebacteria-2]
MIRERRNPKPFGILAALFIVLIVSLVGCEKGTLGLKGGGISGSVLDSRTLVGIAGVSVVATSGEEGEDGRATKFTTSDSNGNYYLSSMRADEWSLSFDKFGYVPLGDSASAAVSVVVVNDNTSHVPSVRMQQMYENQYVTVTGTLKDSINGTLITYGNAQFVFGQQTFSNRLPTELTTGFRVPASAEPIRLVISVSGYEVYFVEFTEGLLSDRDIGTIMLQPETYSIVGRWQDVPGWVFEANPTANIFAYAGNRAVATATATINDQSFTISGIPRGVSVSIEAEVKGYRMNGPIVVYPSGDFQGTIYQTFSLKNNFSPIMRDVRVIITGENIRTNDFVGAYCNETGTRWAQTIVTNPPGWTIGTPRVIELGTNQVPTGYELHFVGYVVGDGKSNEVTTRVDDDGAEAQIVTIQVN